MLIISTRIPQTTDPRKIFIDSHRVKIFVTAQNILVKFVSFRKKIKLIVKKKDVRNGKNAEFRIRDGISFVEFYNL